MDVNSLWMSIHYLAASNISRSEDIVTSKTGSDIGSTFHLLHCSGCSSTIGRVYVSTPAHLDSLRSRFTFLADSVTSYELGKCEFGECVSPVGLQDTAVDTEGLGEKPLAPSNTTLLDLETVKADLTKVGNHMHCNQLRHVKFVQVQNLLLVMDERISRLEEGTVFSITRCEPNFYSLKRSKRACANKAP